MRSELSRLRASLAAVAKERDEARVKADMGEQVRLDLKAWYARLKGVPVESVSDMPGLDLTMVIAALVESRLRASLASAESRLATAMEALESWVQYDDADPQVKGECLREARERTALAEVAIQKGKA